VVGCGGGLIQGRRASAPQCSRLSACSKQARRFHPSPTGNKPTPAARTHGGHLHLGGGLLGDLADEVQQAVARVQGDLVPAGDLLAWGAIRV